jgi:hypothetical protein
MRIQRDGYHKKGNNYYHFFTTGDIDFKYIFDQNNN